MAYTLRTKDNAGDLGRAADQNESVDNDIFFNGQHLAAVSSWDPDKPPVSPHALDDEFADGAVSGNWTEVDADGVTTWTEGDGGILATTVTHAGDSCNGLWKTIPGGDANFTITTKVALYAHEHASGIAGIGLWEDGASANDCWTNGIIKGATAFATQLHSFTWTSYSGGSAAILGTTTVGYAANMAYLRLRRTGTNYYFDYSFDGFGWHSTNAEVAMTALWTPLKMGLIVSNSNTGHTIYSRFSFFRYQATNVGLQGVLLGTRG